MLYSLLWLLGGGVGEDQGIGRRGYALFTQRVQQGEYHNLLQEMRLSDPESHFRYLRMSKERFDCLLGKISFLVKYFKVRTYLNTEIFNRWGLC